MAPDELADYLRERLGDKVFDTSVTYGQLTVTLEPGALPDAARLCKEDPELDFAFFDFMSGVDLKEEGFAVVTHLYSVSHRHHITLRAVAPGGRDEPRLPSLTDVYRGANWHERETYDMFGVEFDGHPGLLPRILTVENFEGFPLRKEFLLSTREAKPWPGLKEPKEADEEEPGDTAAHADADVALAADEKAKAAKERAERAKKKAAEMRAKKARERAAAQQPPVGGEPDESTAAQQLAQDQEDSAAAQQRPAGGEPRVEPARASADEGGEASGGTTGEQASQADLDAPQEPMDAAEAAGTDIAKDAAAGAVAGDTAAGAPQDESGVEEPVENRPAEELAAEGAKPEPGASPGMTTAGRTDAAEPAPPEGDPQSRGGSPRRDEPQGTDAPVVPGHAPEAEVAPRPSEEFEAEEAAGTGVAPGTDAADRRAAEERHPEEDTAGGDRRGERERDQDRREGGGGT